MLGNDRRRLEFAFGLLMSLPGTPMLQYGDEIGMGDDLDLPERECARTPMQWTGEAHGGFSRASTVVRPAIDDATFGYGTRNVEAQRRDPGSLLNWQERIIRMRKECPEISWGDFTVLRTTTPSVLGLCYDWRGTSLVTLHNFSERTVRTQFKPGRDRSDVLVDVFHGSRHAAGKDGAHRITLKPYAWHWLRVGDGDNVLARDALDTAPR
jgi:maltose alpha-D-glucosyltransferase/alpha-amylase